MVILVMLVIMGLSMGIAGSTWKTVMQRAREQELLFRGDQYRRAIKSYTEVRHGGSSGQLPSKLEDLLKDPRFPGTKRHIRKLFKDPMNGEEFVIIKDPRFGGRIKGVHSSSAEEPFKTDGFAEENEKFANASSYQDWLFVFEPPVPTGAKKTPTVPMPGQGGFPIPPAGEGGLPPGTPESNPPGTPGSDPNAGGEQPPEGAAESGGSN
jgi:type II secretory pathway pseudopilin PulG